jgi:hypothetical protein
MIAKWWGCAAVAVAAAALADAPAQADDTFRLGGVRSAADVPTVPLGRAALADDDVELTRHRYYGGYGGYRPYYGGFHRGYYGGFHRPYYGGFYGHRPYYGGYRSSFAFSVGVGGFYGGYRPYYGGYFGYRPYYGGYYGYRPYYNNFYYGGYRPYYGGFAYSYPRYAVSYASPYWCDVAGAAAPAVSLAIRPVSIEVPLAQANPPATTLPAPRRIEPQALPAEPQPVAPAADDQRTFPYDGGPGNPVPQPRRDATPPPPQPQPGLVPTEGTPVSIPGAARKYAYPAYGEDRVPAKTAPTVPGLILTKRTTR